MAQWLRLCIPKAGRLKFDSLSGTPAQPKNIYHSHFPGPALRSLIVLSHLVMKSLPTVQVQYLLLAFY